MGRVALKQISGILEKAISPDNEFSVVSPSAFLVLFFSPCDGLKRMSFLGHFAWNQNKDLQLSPRRKGKAHTRSHTRQRRAAPGESCQLAGGQKSRRGNQAGALSGEKLGQRSPAGVRFQTPVSYHRHMSGSAAFHSSSMGLCSPGSMNKAAMNANARSQLGQREGEAAGTVPASSPPGTTKLSTSSGAWIRPGGILLCSPLHACRRDAAAQSGQQRKNPARWEVVPSHEQPAAGLASAAG